MPQNQEKKKVLPQIIVAVVVALLVGGTAPWWWKEIFPSHDVIPHPPYYDPNKIPLPKPISGGSIMLTATTNPPIISRDQKTTINVYAQNSQGNPLSSAT